VTSWRMASQAMRSLDAPDSTYLAQTRGVIRTLLAHMS
jgi:hypothetical protein